MKSIFNFLEWIRIYFKKERRDIMMAMFFAQRIILQKMTYAQVPKVLKQRVKEILVESGIGELAQE